MADKKMIRLSQAAKRLNVGISTISEHLAKHGHEVGLKPNTKITSEQFALLTKEFRASIAVKQEAAELTIGSASMQASIKLKKPSTEKATPEPVRVEPKEVLPPPKPAASEPKSEGEKTVLSPSPVSSEDTVSVSQGLVSSEKQIEKPSSEAIPPAASPTKAAEPKAPEDAKEVIQPTNRKRPQATQSKDKNRTEQTKTEDLPGSSKKSEESPKIKPQDTQGGKTGEKAEVQENAKPQEKAEKKAEKLTADKPEAAPSEGEPQKLPQPKQAAAETRKETAPPADDKKIEEIEKTKTAEKIITTEKAEGDTAEKAEDDTATPISRVQLRGLKVLDKIELDRKKPSRRRGRSGRKSAGRTTAKPDRKKDGKQPDSLAADASAQKTTPPPPTQAAASLQPSADKPRKAKDEKTPTKEPPLALGKEDTKPPAAPLAEVPAATTAEQPPKTAESEDDAAVIEAKAAPLQGLRVVGKIELPDKKKPKTETSGEGKSKRGKRKRVRRTRTKTSDLYKEQGSQSAKKAKKTTAGSSTPASKSRRGRTQRQEVSQKEVREAFKRTQAKLSGGGDSKAQSKRQYRKEKRSANLAAREQELLRVRENASTLKVIEFIAANELATMMDVSVNEVISKCLEMNAIISINQRLDADTITLIADEFGFDVEFTSAEEETEIVLEEEDKPEDLESRAPIVTIMGHVDHGKTSLLDHIRQTRVAEGEAGGITQHIGAYSVKTDSGRRLVFLDTPGHEAFTAMRARGTKVTDLVIIVIAADDSVMPQTVEAINHAQIADVPIIIAINKMDKPGANAHKIKEELSNLNILVEDWGGKYQCYEISAKTGDGIDDLLEGAILESDLLELKANPNKKATGTVIEASLDKGRGYVTTVLVQAGTLSIGDIMLAGPHYGRVKAMTNHLGKKMKKAAPATPVQILGLGGAPQAGDRLNVLESEREAREIATKRQQILREQNIRSSKRLTLKDIGNRIKIGNFQQLNIIVKGDVDGSVEALSDALLKLSTDEIEVNIIYKAVGAISESDVLLSTASEAIVIGFQVRPTTSARKLAEKEEVEIRLYSVIYDAINDVKDAMEGMLAPDIEEVILGNAEVRETFKISKIGIIAGCMVTDGIIKRNAKIRLIREGIVTYGGEAGGEINALKRFKDDAAEVRQGFECGISIKNYNDLKVGDVIEAFEQREIKRTL